MMEKGQETPIFVRPDGQRFVLVEGLHRLEACKALGETTVPAYFVQARRH
jgi:ParB-like chromosome segregation protein Spo0J